MVPHIGAFDVTFVACHPNMGVMAASDEAKLFHMVATAATISDRPSCFRYLRGNGVSVELSPGNKGIPLERPKYITRKLLSGDLDLGIVGLDTFNEHGQGSEDLIIIHEALEYGDCHLSVAIPQYGIFENVNSMDKLAKMPQWTEEKPLRVAIGFTYMGIADAILDIVSNGTTLRENNLKEIKGGVVLESQVVFIASRKSMIQQKGVLETTQEMLERLEAHLRAIG
ncbi:hypothetical protein JHK82_039740 [Glycine max]|nr:hypothetical protein JHK86_039931 [Glycine max]KAG4965538.1 hypothetical protein JHK85_040513 [Glycine max]KAG5110517.1 hypothetical protein JHK82_039740 [Glycine max]KAG5121806.1 hypothetical protein JHK84_040146 [Glycine max]